MYVCIHVSHTHTHTQVYIYTECTLEGVLLNLLAKHSFALLYASVCIHLLLSEVFDNVSIHIHSSSDKANEYFNIPSIPKNFFWMKHIGLYIFVP